MIDNRNRNRCTYCIVMIVILAGVGVGLSYHFTDGFQKTADEALTEVGQKIKENGITLDHFLNEDPHRNVTGPGDANTWASSSFLLLPGLRLRVLNALTEDWHPFYEIAMSDWGNGNPDVLILTSVTVSADFNCKAEDQVEAAMKVCNGNYGKTGWRGLNTCVIMDGTIVSCLAQMNEFYLQDAADEWKQYTMCHELGHGFGLPHTDIAFWNRDSGNCMDYTDNPRSSMHPDVTNFEFLASIYGSIDGTISAGTSSNSTGVNSSDRGVNRQLRQQTRTTNLVHKAGKQNDDSSRIPGWVSNRIPSLHQQLTRQRRFLLRQQQQQEQLLKSSSAQSSRNRLLYGGETHHIELGQGYSIMVNMLHGDVSAVP